MSEEPTPIYTWPRLLIVIGITALLIMACLAAVLLIRGVTHPAIATGAVAEKRADARSPDEELVKKYILANSKVPGDIEFLVWGPHMTRKEMQMIDKKALEKSGWFGPPPADLDALAGPIIRVVWRNKAAKQDFDKLYRIIGQHTGVVTAVIDSGFNQSGDDWKANVRSLGG